MTQINHKTKIVVVGSLNIDHTYLVDFLPREGETIASREVQVSHGGKGANQAVSAARAGGETQLVGCVGSDSVGESYLRSLEGDAVSTAGVSRETSKPTGSAVILTESSGENLIVVEAGANALVSEAVVENSRAAIEEADVLLLQLEVPLASVKAAAAIARAAGTLIVFNPSPWDVKAFDERFPIDYLIVNEGEATSLTSGRSHSEIVDRWGLKALLITRGGASTLYHEEGGLFGEVPTIPVDPVDTVGAGDTFAGAFAVAIGAGHPAAEAIRFANAAGALATTQVGAQSAIPRKEQIFAVLT